MNVTDFVELVEQLRDIHFEMVELDERVFAITQRNDLDGVQDAYNDFDRKFFAARMSLDRILDGISEGSI